MNEYTINVKEGHGMISIEIESPVQDHEFILKSFNIELSEDQIKRLVKSIIEISEGVFLAERGVDFE